MSSEHLDRIRRQIGAEAQTSGSVNAPSATGVVDPTSLHVFNTGITSTRSDATTLRYPAVATVFLGLMVFLGQRPLLQWCLTKNSAHGLVDNPFHWSVTLLTIAHSQLWAPYTAGGAALLAALIAATSVGFTRTSFIEVLSLIHISEPTRPY